MSAVSKLFWMGFRQIVRDGMLLILLPAPFLMGAALRLLLPFANTLTMREIGLSLVPWYPLSDAIVITMMPIMTAMISAFLMLDERDEGIGAYYAITPAGGTSYLAARIGLPMAWSLISSVIVLHLFALNQIGVSVFLPLVFIATLLGIAIAMLLVTYAGNKVEGLALSKLAGLFTLGIPAAWFLQSPTKIVFSFLPSFWIGESLLTVNLYGGTILVPILAGIISAIIWIGLLTRAFLRRTNL